MKKFKILTLILIPLCISAVYAKEKNSSPESKTSATSEVSYNYSPDQIVQNATLVAKVKWETYPSPHIISVMVEKVFWGRGDFKKGIAGWIEGKDYALDLTPNAWEKTWDAMEPKFVPLGKESILFIDSLARLIGVGEIKGDKVILTCSTNGSKCLVGPKNEIALSSLKVVK